MTNVETGHHRKRKRVALWVLLIWTALMAVWIIAGISATNCGESTTAAERSGCEAGTEIGVAVLVGLWAFGLFVIAAVTVIVRLGRRD